MSADKQLKAYIDRVLRLKEEQDTLGDDIREVYAEAKSEGYDKTIMGKLVAHLRKVAKSGEDAVSEQEMNFDTYLQAYHRASGTAVATHTHEKNSERFDPLTGEFLDDAPRSDAGLDIVTKHTEIATNEGGANQEEELAQGSTPDLEPSGPDVNGHQNSPEEANEMDRDEMRGGEAVHSVPAEKGREAIPVGPEGVDLTHAEAGESPAPAFLTKPPSPLRPHCQRPEMCAGVGRTHCHTCTKAMREQEEFA
ncbi:DUF2312 domain-containing protein [Ensifer sp. ENS07]|uniref:DUF2312 domain-containing protein n=1 Tax=Ensifer sp. ENS07 TaxID=2769274 RepID=UPI001781FC3B|nr:DUF2312 domain-containing protein [Ensifer sp. ENS07]MBD9635443.1 DUF2312 domain-containing protein [Ensifer sp. ENS07]